MTTLRRRGRITAVRLLLEPSDPATLLARDPLNVANATNVSNYHLFALTRSRRTHAITVHPVALASATYSHVTIPASATYGPFEAVTLTPVRPIPEGQTLQLVVDSSTTAIDGADGIPLDGDGDRQPGGNFTIGLNGR